MHPLRCVSINSLSNHRAPISLPMVVKAPTNTKSSFPISYKANMPVRPGFHPTRKRSSKPSPRTSAVPPISEKPRTRSPPSSKRSSRRQKAPLPNGRPSGCAGAEKYDRAAGSNDLMLRITRPGYDPSFLYRHAFRCCRVHSSCDGGPQRRAFNYHSILSPPVHA